MMTIINYRSGNIEAIANIYKRLNTDFAIAETPEHLISASKLILPGVGVFDKTIQQLIDSGLKAKLDDLVLNEKIPVLGICVGMQIMSDGSDEGQLPGLGWINGQVRKIDTADFTQKPYLPHMGWNSIESAVDHPLFDDIDQEFGFYFLHTYYFECTHQDDILCTTHYGKKYTSAIYHENVYGVQFHPEKSHGNGIRLLKNFAKL